MPEVEVGIQEGLLLEGFLFEKNFRSQELTQKHQALKVRFFRRIVSFLAMFFLTYFLQQFHIFVTFATFLLIFPVCLFSYHG